MKAKRFDFNPFGNRALVFEFVCDKCGYKIESDEVDIPMHNYSEDRMSDNQADTFENVNCEKCDKEFTIEIYTTPTGGTGNIIDLPGSYEVYVKEIQTPTC